MNPYDPYIEADWADGTYRFRLGIDEIAELENICIGATGERSGIAEILGRIASRKWFAKDITETIRLGLIGSGDTKPVDAKRLVRMYVEARPLLENFEHAYAIIGRALMPPDPIKKKARKVKPEAPIKP